MKNNLIVTLSDASCIKQAKQLFSSIYHNSGWDGDYMLLAYEIHDSKLQWFRKKGVLIKKVKPLINFRQGNLPPTVFAKFYLFTQFFKKWNKIIYLDADIIVQAPITQLTKLHGFNAVKDYLSPKLFHQFENTKQNPILSAKLKKNFILNEKAFNSGVMVFSTDIIEKSTIKKLSILAKTYLNILRFGEQSPLNLYFYKKWKALPIVYNTIPFYIEKPSNIEKIKTIILHFAGEKPWKETKKYHSAYKLWERSLKKAESIKKLSKAKPKKSWTEKEIIQKSKKLERKLYLNLLTKDYEHFKGVVGEKLSKYFPALYKILKKFMQREG